MFGCQGPALADFICRSQLPTSQSHSSAVFTNVERFSRGDEMEITRKLPTMYGRHLPVMTAVSLRPRSLPPSRITFLSLHPFQNSAEIRLGQKKLVSVADSVMPGTYTDQIGITYRGMDVTSRPPGGSLQLRPGSWQSLLAPWTTDARA